MNTTTKDPSKQAVGFYCDRLLWQTAKTLAAKRGQKLTSWVQEAVAEKLEREQQAR